MRILAIHNFHRRGSASGDDQVFRNETKLMEMHGNEVIRYSVSNDSFDNASVFKKAGYIFGMFWSWRNYRAVQKLIDQYHPDIVHVHTFFPLLSPSVLYAAKRKNVRVAATLHDTRLICPVCTSLRDMQVCNECLDGHYFRMCRYKCFKGSSLQSFIVACIFSWHRKKQTFYKQIDQYICLNDSQCNLLKQAGFAPEKIVKKYNFVPDVAVGDIDVETKRALPGRYVVFYGRIGEEKGIHVLYQIWNQIPDIPLVVMGAGPLEDEFKTWAGSHKNVFYLGYVEHGKCLPIVKNAEFTVFPSIWYEGCSMVEIECESVGKAIIATDIGFSAEAIKDGRNGYKITLGDINTFIKKIRELWMNPVKAAEMGTNARKDYESKYLPEENYRQLIGIYEKVMNL